MMVYFEEILVLALESFSKKPEIEKLESDESRLEKELANPDHFNDLNKLQEIDREFQKVKADLEGKNEDWEKLATEVEQMTE